jgi:hypothetical protein
MGSKAMILKGGARRRAAVPAARQAELVREFERSDLSAPQFAASAGVRYATFAAWRRRHERQQPLRVESPAWLEAVAETGVGEEAITLRLPGGATVEIARPRQAALAAHLLKAITAMPC